MRLDSIHGTPKREEEILEGEEQLLRRDLADDFLREDVHWNRRWVMPTLEEMSFYKETGMGNYAVAFVV
jgi:hypothetical protein